MRSEGVLVEVTRAPIEIVLLSEQFDAVVSSDDAALTMYGGVAGAILRLAGPGLAQEARRIAPLQIGDVRVTSGFALPLKYVLHAATADLQKGIRPTERTVRHLAREIFVRCEALEIHRVAIPAVGVGAVGVPARVSAREFSQVLHRHTQNTSVLDRVVFSVPNADAYRCFVFELTGKTDQQAVALPEVIERSFALEQRDSSEETTLASTKPVAAQPAPHDTRPLIGQRYVLLEEIGRGGLGVVHLAWDLILRRVVAIKKLREGVGTPDSLRREAAIAMDLTHEGIVRTYHFEPRVEEGGPYVVMEYMPWSTGEKWIADAGEGGLPAVAVLDVGTQVCRALEYAHARGVLHLDVKPGNIFVDPAGERTKLADFGLSRVLTQSAHRALLLEAAGTPAYMAPEQMTPGRKVSPATDIYQLAACLWDLLTGRPPSGAADAEESRPSDRGRALRALRPALAVDPAARPPDAGAFERVLAGVISTL